jgi:cold-inducible RNA-binding protein
MTNRISVGGLTVRRNGREIAGDFSAYGTVQPARVITDKAIGRSKRFGFVEMSSNAEIESTIKALNGNQLDGRSLTVNEARRREPRAGMFETQRYVIGKRRDTARRGDCMLDGKLSAEDSSPTSCVGDFRVPLRRWVGFGSGRLRCDRRGRIRAHDPAPRRPC